MSWLKSVGTSTQKAPAPTGVLYIYNALAFSTLLSSQETDAHRVLNFRSSLGATHLIYPGCPACQIARIWHFRISRAISIQPIGSGANSTRRSVGACYRWLPGSGTAIRRSLPLGATRTLRVLSTYVKSFLGSKHSPPAEASNLRVEPEPDPVQQAEPGVAAPLVRVGPGDRGAGELDDTRPQRLRGERDRLRVDQ
jgi:hypothetical protein